MIHATEKSLKDYGDKVGAADKQAIEAAMAELRAVMDGDDATAIKAKTDNLAQVSMKLGEAMYKDSQGAAGAGAGGEHAEAGASGEKVVDAEFEEVDPEKKAS
jgi:molecular chaperone DnaK